MSLKFIIVSYFGI